MISGCNGSIISLSTHGCRCLSFRRTVDSTLWLLRQLHPTGPRSRSCQESIFASVTTLALTGLTHWNDCFSSHIYKVQPPNPSQAESIADCFPGRRQSANLFDWYKYRSIDSKWQFKHLPTFTWWMLFLIWWFFFFQERKYKV